MKKRLMLCVVMLSIVTAVLAQDAKVVGGHQRRPCGTGPQSS